MKNEVIELLKGQIDVVKSIKNLQFVKCQISFSQDDVSWMLQQLIDTIEVMEEKPTSVNLDDIKERVMENIINVIENHDYDENISLDLNYDRTIETSFDIHKLERDVRREIDDIFNSIEEEMEEENEKEEVE